MSGGIVISGGGGIALPSIDWSGAQWTEPPFDAGDFTGANAMTWTVEAADIVTWQYMLIGNLYLVQYDLQTTTIGGTPDPTLQMAIYEGKRIVGRNQAVGYMNNNGTEDRGRIVVQDSGVVIGLTRNLAAGNWAASTNNTRVAGQMLFRVEDIP